LVAGRGFEPLTSGL